MLYSNCPENNALGSLLSGIMCGLVGNAPENRMDIQIRPVGDDIYFTDVCLADSDGSPVNDAVVAARINGRALVLYQIGDGLYSGHFEHTDDRIAVDISAVRDDLFLAETRREIYRSRENREMRNAAANHHFLKRLSSETDCAYVELNALDKNVAERLLANAIARTHVRSVSLWRKGWVFVLLCVLLSANWYIQRRY